MNKPPLTVVCGLSLFRSRIVELEEQLQRTNALALHRPSPTRPSASSAGLSGAAAAAVSAATTGSAPGTTSSAGASAAALGKALYDSDRRVRALRRRLFAACERVRMAHNREEKLNAVRQHTDIYNSITRPITHLLCVVLCCRSIDR
jgi:hypothetical protein